MADFRRGEIQVLVSTSVVEVGVDVPNATLMTIEGGHRFGLAQLHQLRGRISRGKFPGFCCVFGDPQTEESRERLKAFVASTDGFELAETDFRLRGPGDVFGTRQHGLPPLRIADLLRDQSLLEEARRDAHDLVTADPGPCCRRAREAAADDAGALREGAGFGRRGMSRGTAISVPHDGTAHARDCGCDAGELPRATANGIASTAMRRSILAVAGLRCLDNPVGRKR